MIKESNWWNTSDGLRERFPHIAMNEDWISFSCEYDKPSFQKSRLKHWQDSSPSLCIPFMLYEIRELAELALGKIPPLPRLIFKEEITPQVAGEYLAKAILNLVSKKNSHRLKAFADAVNEHHNPKKVARNSSDLIWALIQFIEREGRLPKKKELNIEAGRISRLSSLDFDFSKPPPTFGAIHKECSFVEYAEPRQYRVYGVRNDEHEQCIWVCPKELWDEPRWDKKEFSGNLGACGLRGLGGANTHPNDKNAR